MPAPLPAADVLAGKPARNHVNTASPWISVKGANVIPNRERREKAVILSGDEYACGVGLALDSADGAPAKEFASEYSATSTCE
jgi:putative intracellular protease/amidase